MRLASFARVLVDAIPTETGMPVHCRTFARSSRQYVTPCHGSSPRKASSMEYTSMLVANGRRVAITRADMSP